MVAPVAAVVLFSPLITFTKLYKRLTNSLRRVYRQPRLKQQRLNIKPEGSNHDEELADALRRRAHAHLRFVGEHPAGAKIGLGQ